MGPKELEKDVGLAKINGPLGRNLKDKAKVAGDSEASPSSRSWAASLQLRWKAWKGLAQLLPREGWIFGPFHLQKRIQFRGSFDELGTKGA